MRVFVTGGSGFIGTNLVDELRAHGATVVNFDAAPPMCGRQAEFWHKGDILDRADLSASLAAFEPTHVVHLAARADLSETRDVARYPQNIEGMSNLLAAVRKSSSTRRLIVTSTQLVCRPGYWPRHDEDYAPDTVYGQSKVITEQLTRRADLPCVWTIIRPTNIWGPWLLRHRDHFFAALRRGLYRHPGGRSARRCWGYVGNVVHQIRRILELPADRVDRQTLYVGDAPFELVDWVHGVSIALTGRRAKTAPRGLLYAAALVGDLAQKCGMRAPLSTARYKAMTEDFLVPIERTLRLIETSPYSMQQGIDETVRWLTDPDFGTASATRVLSEQSNLSQDRVAPMVAVQQTVASVQES